MSKKFRPPFRIEVYFYDVDGETIEWHECWGPCPNVAKIEFVIEDIDNQVISTWNTRERAEKALAKYRELQL